MCAPFYCIGSLAAQSDFKGIIHRMGHYAYIVIAFLIIAYYFGVIYNGAPWVYKADYGTNILLFFTNATIGVLILAFFSIKLERIYTIRIFGILISTINIGSLFILGYQNIYIDFINKVVRNIPLLFSVFNNDANSILLTFILSLIGIGIFLPFVKMVKKYIPFLLGGR